MVCLTPFKCVLHCLATFGHSNNKFIEHWFSRCIPYRALPCRRSWSPILHIFGCCHHVHCDRCANRLTVRWHVHWRAVCSISASIASAPNYLQLPDRVWSHFCGCICPYVGHRDFIPSVSCAFDIDLQLPVVFWCYCVCYFFLTRSPES